jgi:hypothetical protein
MNKVVARYADGRLVKGMTADFFPTKDRFHISVASAAPGTPLAEIYTKDLKALFFVKDHDGDPQHVEKRDFDPERPPVGLKIRVAFKDGEVMVGTTTGYQPGRVGFFLIPADPDSNTERCYVVAASTDDISFI